MTPRVGDIVMVERGRKHRPRVGTITRLGKRAYVRFGRTFSRTTTKRYAHTSITVLVRTHVRVEEK